MSTVHSNTADAFTPEDFGVLVNLAVQAKSIAASSATVFGTDKVKVNFPLWESDPAVGWYNELDEIVAADGTTGEVECIPSKTAGITRISNELRDDSTRLSLTSSAPRWRTRSLATSTRLTSPIRPRRLRVGFRASSTPRWIPVSA